MNTDQHLSKFYTTSADKPRPNKRYLVTSEAEITHILKSLTVRPELITVYLKNTNDFLITTLLGIDENNTCLYIDDVKDQKKRNNIISNKTLTITTQLNGIKFLFPVNVIGKTLYKDQFAFKISFPDYILKLQRREFFRTAPPLNHILKCQLNISDININVDIADISEGGLSLVDRNNLLFIKPDTVIKSCQINLPKLGVIESDLKVNRVTYSENDPKRQTKYIGCEYIQPGNMTTALIRRYILKVDRYNQYGDKVFN